MFNSFSKTETKIAVLEERLTSYETMIKKIDEAIQIMGKTSQSISKMLAVHEEKLDQNVKSDSVIMNMIHEMKSENREDHEKVIDRIEKLEIKIEDFVKFRWLIAGGIVIFTFVVSNSTLIIDVLTPVKEPDRMERLR